MTRGEQTGLAWGSTIASWLTLEINPILSALASIFALVLSCMLIYKAYLDIKERRQSLRK
jgi:hypothetical protein